MQNEQEQQDAVNHVYSFAANMLVQQNKSSYETIDALKMQGLDVETATTLVSNLEGQIKKAKRDRAQKDMLYGGLWCIGGTAATFAHIGFIFWGAIVFGAVQFFKGLFNYV